MINDDVCRECRSWLLCRCGRGVYPVVSVKAPSEHAETVALMQWWELARRQYGLPARALFHIANEGKRSVVMGQMLKAEGLRPGTPDLFLAVKREGFGGMFVEMKRAKGGRVSDTQREALAEYESLGYAVTIAHGADEAIEAITGYLRTESPDAGLLRFLRV